MPLHFTPLEYLLARLNILPAPLFDIPLAPGIAKVLVTACELDIFDILGKEALTAQELAEKLQCDPQGLQVLLSLLVSTAYLRLSNGAYRNTRLTLRWLTSISPFNIAPYILHSPDIIAIWDHLPEVVRTGKPAMRLPYEDDSSVANGLSTIPKSDVASRTTERQRFLARHYTGLASLATALGGEIINRISIPRDAAHLLDVGGSHAGYSVLFCRKYPRLHATILDIQPGIEAGQQTVRQMELEERMSFVCCDIVRDDFPTQFSHPFDIALYFHIAHLLQPEVNRAVLSKVARTLRPGGVLAFVDQITDSTYGSHLSSLIVQFMTLTTVMIGGTCYPFDTVKSWLEDVGMEQVRGHRLLMPGASLITAIKKA